MQRLFVALLFCGLTMNASAQMYGAWELAKSVDPITDENSSFIAVLSERHPPGADISGIVFRCDLYMPHGVRMVFKADRYLGDEALFPVIYRIDSRDPVSTAWDASLDRTALSLHPSRVIETDELFAGLETGSTLVIRISASTEIVTYTMPIHGLLGALRALECYRSPPR